jgi:type II secretory pathway pseudopilin PulG
MCRNIAFRGRSLGFTLVEVLVCFGIISLLIALILPAVQAARESARRIQCLNNLRNLAIGAQSFEAAHRHLPGPVLNAHPSSGMYHSDMGLFVGMLPFVEQQSLYSQFDTNVPSNSIPNKRLIAQLPPILKCPSSGESEMMHDMAGYFSGPAVAGLDAPSCDYVGNHGVFFDNQTDAGPGSIRVRIGTIVKEHRIREIVDGTSNTLIFWESMGDSLYRGIFKTNADLNSPDSFRYMVIGSQRFNMHSNTKASYKSYMFAWSGFRCGAIDSSAVRLINFSNDIGQPYSSHISVLPIARIDGSTDSLSQEIDPTVLIGLATSSGAELLDEIP